MLKARLLPLGVFLCVTGALRDACCAPGPSVQQVAPTHRSSTCFQGQPEAGTLRLRANKIFGTFIFANTESI